MSNILRTGLSGLALCAILVGCAPQPKAAHEYDIVGKVTAIAADKSTATIDHEAIPGLMKGMEMKFRLANPEVVKGIEPGDAVTGKLRTQDGFTIVSLVKTPAEKSK